MKMKLISAAVLASMLPGCAQTSLFQKEADDHYSGSIVRTSDKIKEIVDNRLDKPMVFKARGAWIGGKSIPVASDNGLPDIFKQDWAFTFPDRVNISTIAERITKVTGIPVRVKPDVFMPASSFVTGGAAAPATTTDTGGSASGEGYSVSQSHATDGGSDMELNFNGTLSGLLDHVSARAGINWEYKDGTIELYRMVVRHFTLKAPPGDSNFTASVGKSGTTQGGTSGGSGGSSASQSSFQSDANIKMTSAYSVWPSIESAIKAMLSPAGKMSVSQATGTITVTDTKEIVDDIGSLIDHENTMLTRQVRMKIEVLNVSLSKEHQSGVDWGVVYSKLDSALNPQWKFNFGTPGTLTDTSAGKVGLTLTGMRNNGLTASLNGTSAMIKALSAYGQVSVATTTSAVTLNRQPVPVTMTDQIGYLAATTPATNTTGSTGGGTPGLTPGMVTTGYVLNLLPTVLDNSNVLLQFAVDISELKGLNTVSSGSGDTLQSIQTPEVSGMQFLQRAALKPGETLVLAGFERYNGQYDKRNLREGSNSNLDGSFSGKSKREAIVIMITPVVEEGG